MILRSAFAATALACMGFPAIVQEAHAQELATSEKPDPLAPVADRVGPLWLASEATELPNGRKFIDAKRYTELLRGKAIQVDNYRLLEDGRLLHYLHGIYSWDGEMGTIVHMAVFNNGGVVRNARYALETLEADETVMDFQFVLPDGSVSDWQSRESIIGERHLIEKAFMRDELGEWADQGMTTYAPFARTDDVAVLAEYFAAIE